MSITHLTSRMIGTQRYVHQNTVDTSQAALFLYEILRLPYVNVRILPILLIAWSFDINPIEFLMQNL